MSNTILTYLKERDRSSPVYFSSNESKNAGEIVDFIAEIRANEYETLKGKGVALYCETIADYLLSLCALDGWVDRILLMDSTMSLVEQKLLEEQAEVSYRIKGASVSSLVVATGNGNAVQSDFSEWVIPTSGTTGQPKLVAHTFESLVRTVKVNHKYAGKLRWGLIYSPTRFAGVQVILQAIGGESTLILPEGNGNLEQDVACLVKFDCNALSGTPSLWRKLALQGLLHSLSLDIVTLGGEIADQKILDVLKQQFPNATLRHIYASTEAGVGFSVGDGNAGFPMTYLDNPPLGIELKVDESGMLSLRSAQNGAKYIGQNLVLTDQAGWLESGDIVELCADRYRFLGRENGAINIGGSKVQPSYVEEIILEVEGVTGARIYGKPNPIMGALVVAEVTIGKTADVGEVKKSITAHCMKRLERFQRPVIIEVVEQFELTSNGKIKR